jgi:hypothetical protein
MRLFTIAVALAASIVPAFSQVTVTGSQSADKSTGSAQVTISTADRTTVPMVVETKNTKVDATTTRSDSVARAQLNDGSYFDWRTTSSVTRSNATTIQTTTDTTERDRQGGVRATKSSTKTVTKTDRGEQTAITNYRRDAGGTLVRRAKWRPPRRRTWTAA